MMNKLIVSEKELFSVYRELESYSGFIGWDTETYGQTTDWVKRKSDRVVWDFTSKLAGMSFSFKENSYYLPIAHTDARLPPDLVRRFFRAFFKLPNRLWAHNIDYDSRVIRNFMGEYHWPDKFGDSMVLVWLLNAGVKVIRNGKEVFLHGLKDLVRYHFLHEMTKYEDLVYGNDVQVSGPSDEDIGSLLLSRRGELIAERKQQPLFPDDTLRPREEKRLKKYERELINQRTFREAQMNDLSAEYVLDYACEDAFWSNQLAIRFWPELQRMRYAEMWDALEMPVLKIIREMHDVGQIIDQGKVQDIKQWCYTVLRPLDEKFTRETGASVKSSQQCAAVFYRGYTPVLWEDNKPKALDIKYLGGLFPIKDCPTTPGGEPGTNYEALQWAKHVCKDDPYTIDLIDTKLRYAEVSKLATTYTNSVIAQIPFSPDGRVHPRYNQVGTNTGRFSSSNPFNAQNFPTKSDSMPDIREAFIPPPGYVYASMDLSQIEIILMAHFSADERLREVILEGKSMHDVTSEALGIERKIAKALNFLKNYGGGAKKLAQSLNVPLEEDEKGRMVPPQWVKNYCDRYDELYSGVTAFRASMSDYAAQYGYVETILGRRRMLPEIRPLKEQLRVIEERCRKGYIMRKHKKEAFDAHAQRTLDELLDKRRALTLKLYHLERIASNTPIQGSAADLIKLAMVGIHSSWKERNVDNHIVMQIHDELVFYLREETAKKELDIIRDIMINVIKISLPINASGGLGKTWGECK